MDPFSWLLVLVVCGFAFQLGHGWREFRLDLWKLRRACRDIRKVNHSQLGDSSADLAGVDRPQVSPSADTVEEISFDDGSL